MSITGGDIRLLFATEAYGMGTDSSDIRRVIHVGPPATIESKQANLSIVIVIVNYNQHCCSLLKVFNDAV